MDHVLHQRLPSAPWMAEATRRLPGLQPLVDKDGWLLRDEAYSGQMALRDRLVAERRNDVIAVLPVAEAAVAELHGEVLRILRGRDGYRWSEGQCLRPDGVEVDLVPDDPLGTLARLVQQDLCVLEKPQGAAEHMLTAAVLCFPASWTLAEKIGRGMLAIHDPVADYDVEMARRVQRVFDHLRVGAPIWRQNAMVYVDPDLFQPRSVDAPRQDRARGSYLRSELQALMRLPRTGAVVFSIHSYVLPMAALSAAQRAGVADDGHAR